MNDPVSRDTSLQNAINAALMASFDSLESVATVAVTAVSLAIDSPASDGRTVDNNAVATIAHGDDPAATALETKVDGETQDTNDSSDGMSVTMIALIAVSATFGACCLMGMSFFVGRKMTADAEGQPLTGQRGIRATFQRLRNRGDPHSPASAHKEGANGHAKGHGKGKGKGHGKDHAKHGKGHGKGHPEKHHAGSPSSHGAGASW
jgi:hypothetical protein